MEPRFIYFETYGCSANQNNTEIMRGMISQAGLSITNNPKIADILVLNTCIVKEPTEKKMEDRIKKLANLKKPLIVAGCMPNVCADFLSKFQNVHALGIKDTKKIIELIKNIANENSDYNKSYISEANEIKLLAPKLYSKKKIGITQILEGCTGSCSFCITRLAKGKLFSYPKEQIIQNIKKDIENGCKEIWLTSQDNAAYGLDIDGKYHLTDLLKEILNIEGKFKVRLGMMNPNHVLKILDELIEIYKNEKMYKFLHIPVQSGSNRILKLMNRQYKIADFLKIIKKFKKEIPNLTISTDIIVAFPEETEEDFNETKKLLGETKPQILNISKYWAMKNTPASKMQQISSAISTKRAKEIMLLHKEIAESFHKTLLNKELNVLVNDSLSKNNYIARSDDYILVVIKSPLNLLGKFLKVKVTKTALHYVYADVV